MAAPQQHDYMGHYDEYFIHVLRYEDRERDSKVAQIVRLSQTIFADTPGTAYGSHYASADEWLRRLSMPGAHIVYISRTHVEPTSFEKVMRAVAFVFVHPRRHDESPLQGGVLESAHIWIAGVSPGERNKGLLAEMVARVEAEVRGDIRDGVCTGVARMETTGNSPLTEEWRTVMLTVCTMPSKFPAMWAWLQARNWNVEREMKGKVLLSKALRI
ncbi:hypothetical protein ONZ45_g1317 [Pleurotus djamor]|nr:hypothetical protein ONZ45_g1317 [Pleurotus djamor]